MGVTLFLLGASACVVVCGGVWLNATLSVGDTVTVSVAEEWGFSTATKAVDVTQMAALTVSGAAGVERGSAMASWLTMLGVGERVGMGDAGVAIGKVKVAGTGDKFTGDCAACVLTVEAQPPLTHRTKMIINSCWMFFR